MSTVTLPESSKNECPLCGEQTNIYALIKDRNFYKCNNCSSIHLESVSRLDENSEKKRYLEHNNDVNDERYRKFVSPITDYILSKYTGSSLGLDFGAGTGPVISCVLTEKGYNINNYDPYFFPEKSVLGLKYDYIVCCEVIEHFYNPKKEFLKLFDCLKNKGELICKTELFEDAMNFDSWYYKNDPTHVFFYSKDTFLWIKNNLAFTTMSIDQRIVIFEK